MGNREVFFSGDVLESNLRVEVRVDIGDDSLHPALFAVDPLFLNLIYDFVVEVAVDIIIDGENIAFVDCTIYDGGRIGYNAEKKGGLNDMKKAIAEEGENNYIINASFIDEGGLQLHFAAP